MHNLIWTITLYRRGTEYGIKEHYVADKMKYYLAEGATRVVKIGNNCNMDIWITQAFPHHLTLEIKQENFHLHAHKKLICQDHEKSEILTKGEQKIIPLSSLTEQNSIGHILKIKDVTVKSILRCDPRVLDPSSQAYQYLKTKYGSIVKVGEGRIALVYQTCAGKPMIFKILKNDYNDPKYIERFLWSANTIRHLKHPQIPVLLETIHEPAIGLYGYVMEAFPGETLRNRIVRQRQLEGTTALDFFTRLTQCIHYLHKQNKVHRNLNPENILIDSGSNCQVVGYTFLRTENLKSSKSRKSMIYPGFTAPEEIEHPETTDHRADIFSLGAIFYLVLSGFPPFFIKSSKEYADVISHGLPPLEFPSENRYLQNFKELISKCMAQKPDNRWDSIESLWKEFQQSAEKVKFLVPSLQNFGELSKDEEVSEPEIEVADFFEFSDFSEVSELLDSSETARFPHVPPAITSLAPFNSIFHGTDRTLGKFKIQSELGRGAVGIVYRALDTQLQREVALKVLLKGYIPNASELERFLREARSASSLNHPNIVAVHEVGETQNAYYIAMQLIEGMNLQQYQETHPFSPRQALVLIRDIARALHHAHTKGIIHRDVKPSNIMVDGQGKPYLMDFGLAKDMRTEYKLTKSGEVVGTLVYMAPEILDGYPPSISQDVYSLGVILYELLTGQSLVEIGSSLEVLTKIANTEPVFPRIKRKIASDAETICLKALEKKPARRYQTAAEFAEDIDRFLECKPILAKRPSIIYRGCKYIVRHGSAFAVAAFSSMIILAVSIYMIWLYPASLKNQQLNQLHQHISELNEQFQKAYLKALDALPPLPDPEGLSKESEEAEKKAAAQIREVNRAQYRNSLIAEVIPLCRQAYQMSQQAPERRNLLDLLKEVVKLCDNEDQRRPFRLEILSLQGENAESLDVPATVLIQGKPSEAQIYLYQFVETKDGRKRAMPFSPEKKTLLEVDPKEKERMTAKEDFLRCQNLLWEASFQMLNRNFYAAENSLRRSVEISPDYIDAYFLLSCKAILSGEGDVASGFSDIWMKQAMESIHRSNLPQPFKDKLFGYFTPGFVKKVSTLYQYLPQRNYQEKPDFLIKVTSLPEKDSPLQIGDLILKIDDISITSEATLIQALRSRERMVCSLIRDFSLQRFDITNCVDSYFQVTEEPPVLFIWDNIPLSFNPEDSIYCLNKTMENMVRTPTIFLPTGEYLLTLDAPGHFSMRYPFSVVRETSMGLPFTSPIFCSLPLYQKKYQKFFKDLVPIPKSFVEGTPEEQNMTGYLIGRYEVTLSEWLDYLKAVNGPLPWDWQKIKDRLPYIEPNKPLFHLRKDGDLVLRLGNIYWPVFGVTYKQIEEYLEWLNKSLPLELKNKNFRFRLPNSQEWLQAARGSDGRLYSWGNYPNPKFCKILDARKYQYYQEAIAKNNPAFLCDESPFGVNDMCGSVSEWTSTNRFSSSNKLYEIKGTGWSDSKLSPLETTWYSAPAVQRVSRGFRVCAGMDPLFTHEKYAKRY